MGARTDSHGAWMRVLVPLLALCGLAAGAARAQGGVAEHAYPLTARLEFDAEHRDDRCRVRDDENCDIALGESLRTAYETVVRRMFESPAAGAAADLDITVSPVVADVIEGMGAREVMLEARVIIRSATAGELERVSYSARSPVLGPERASIVNAADRASQEITGEFEKRFADSKPVFNWLHGRGVEPFDSALSWPLRADWIAFLDLGAGPVLGGGDAAAPGLLAHLGIASRWFVTQAIVCRWVAPFHTAIARNPFPEIRYNADLATTDLGIEAGLRMRVGNAMELRAGGGVHALWGTAEVHTSAQTEPTSSFSTVTPTVFGTAQYVFWPTGSRFRIRVGVELRGYLSTNVDLVVQEFSRKVSVADGYLGVYLGFETPLGSTPARGGGPGK